MVGQNTSHAVMAQRWAPIPDWDGYEVSDYGNVRSWKQRSRIARRTWAIDYSQPPHSLRPCNRNGYPSVLLIRDGTIRRWFLIHVLMLTVFVGPRPTGMQGAHNDGNRDNNQLSNLRWDTPAGNNADKIKHGTHQHGERIASSKLTAAQVRLIRTLRPATTVRALAQQFGVCLNTITNITQGHYWKGTQNGSEHLARRHVAEN